MMMAAMRLRRFIRDDRASTLVETSIILSILLVLLFGAIDWSRYYYNRARLRSAVRRGALYGARLPSALFDSALVATTTRNAFVGTATERALGTVLVEQTGSAGIDPRVSVMWTNYPFTRATSLVMRTSPLDSVQAEFRKEQP